MNSIAGYPSKICKIYKHLPGTLKRSKKGLKFIVNYIYGEKECQTNGAGV